MNAFTCRNLRFLQLDAHTDITSGSYRRGNPGVYVRDKRSGVYTALFESDGTYVGDETVGVALSPDRRRFYAGVSNLFSFGGK